MRGECGEDRRRGGRIKMYRRQEENHPQAQPSHLRKEKKGGHNKTDNNEHTREAQMINRPYIRQGRVKRGEQGG